MMTIRKFELHDKDGVKATITIEGLVAGAEQNIIILDSSTGFDPVAVIELRPGFDRREVKP